MKSKPILKFERYIHDNITSLYTININSILNVVLKDIRMRNGKPELNFEYIEKLLCGYLQKVILIKVTNIIKDALENPKNFLVFEGRMKHDITGIIKQELQGSEDLIEIFKGILMEIENLYYKFNEEEI